MPSRLYLSAASINFTGVSLEGRESNTSRGVQGLSVVKEGFGRQLLKFLVIGLTSSQIASNAFTWGTVAVLPFYTLMVLAPKASFTRRTMESSVPYIALGVLYAYLLYLSWTPDTFRMMFASKYWLPELAGIAKMFTNELTVASAWIHLLAVDLFAARSYLKPLSSFFEFVTAVKENDLYFSPRETLVELLHSHKISSSASEIKGTGDVFIKFYYICVL
ncbi:hypothetical protein C4D60_Mb07t17320 [Musa balbisiana]|uniref:Uncharacterized protein n=1 Tax=Musa balbisiana TaxID=52838 RepID=A0A4S8JFY7_MUSBA|nr:hypothetical protein C4D60_Mb07t17320 [Musa balbisiana]